MDARPFIRAPRTTAVHLESQLVSVRIFEGKKSPVGGLHNLDSAGTNGLADLITKISILPEPPYQQNGFDRNLGGSDLPLYQSQDLFHDRLKVAKSAFTSSNICSTA